MQTLFSPPSARGLFPHPHHQTSLICTNKSSTTFCSTFSRYSLVQFSNLQFNTARRIKGEERSIGRLQAIQASEASQPSGGAIGKWVFQFVGDGSTSHIGQAVSLPSTFELASDAATVGRLPDKADIVIPIATVSGLHARLEKKGGMLFVTDLNSTNGTYIDEKKLSPGAVTPLSPQSRITFGDIHLAQFQFSREETNDSIKVESSDSTVEEDTSNK